MGPSRVHAAARGPAGRRLAKRALALATRFPAAEAAGRRVLGSRRLAAWPLQRLAAWPLQRLALAATTLAIAACLPSDEPGALEPTLTIEAVSGGEVAIQNGIPVPTFERQERPTIDLDGTWRVEAMTFDSDLSLTPRSASLERIVADARGRTDPGFDDSRWETLDVPGSLNPPPSREQPGAWYRRSFLVPQAWEGRAVTLKFQAANYIADVWLNGTWLGYHEGGTTPFAFDAGPALLPGGRNVVAVRVDNPEWGSRIDIVPWGLADWHNFGGLTRPVWLEAADPLHVVRADVFPHLDGGDVDVVLHNRGEEARTARVDVEILPGLASGATLLDPDPRSLLTGAAPVVRVPLDPVTVEPGAIIRLDAGFLLADPARWSPTAPALYVLRVVVDVDGEIVDTVHDSFGLRQVAVDAERPALLLNGRRVVLPGVALHDQWLYVDGDQVRGRIPTPDEILVQLSRAQEIGARLIRAGHTPPNPNLLRLADRLGLAVWEEIPLYHYTPRTFEVAMGRGIPQQMLREMALRDQNRPSVLFRGLANESTGEEARLDALRELHDIDRRIDGTRLTGQAAYGFAPADPTSEPLDVAGYTFYHGVFYGDRPPEGTIRALDQAHEAYPAKPIMVLEFGRWSDGTDGLAEQRRIFADTADAIFARRGTLPGGYVGAGVWWTLEDYATLVPRIDIEHFGLFAYDGTPRPVAEAAREIFAAVPPPGVEPEPGEAIVPGGRGVPATATRTSGELVAYLAYGAAVSLGALGALLLLLARRGGRSTHRPGRPDGPGGAAKAGEAA